MKKILICLGIIVFSFQFSAFSQELKYIFDKGQVLQYEHITEVKRNYSNTNEVSKTIKILEFEVLDILRNKYAMNMTVRASKLLLTLPERQ